MVKLYKRVGRNLVSAGDWPFDDDPYHRYAVDVARGATRIIELEGRLNRRGNELSTARQELARRSAELIEAQDLAIAAGKRADKCEADRQRILDHLVVPPGTMSLQPGSINRVFPAPPPQRRLETSDWVWWALATFVAAYWSTMFVLALLGT